MSRVFACSVVPVARLNGEWFLLLGKNRRVHSSAEAEAWTDFGGSKQEGESEEECAAREFWEETCCVVPWFLRSSDQLTRVPYYDVVVTRFSRQHRIHVYRSNFGLTQVLAMCTKIVHYVQGGHYVMYVLEVPMLRHITDDFNDVWREIHARFFAQTVRPAQERYLVHESVRLSLPDIQSTPIVRQESVETETIDLASEQPEEINFREVSEASLSLLETASTVRSRTVASGHDTSIFTGTSSALEHPACKSRDTSHAIDGAFVEKKAIRWFSLDRIRVALSTPGHYLQHDSSNMERLAPSFVERLAAVVDHAIPDLE